VHRHQRHERRLVALYLLEEIDHVQRALGRRKIQVDRGRGRRGRTGRRLG
jgi:hypothetical protein